MKNSIALLPMYDWPEIRAETDRFWDGLRDAFRRRRIGAPDGLTREDAVELDRPGQHWTLNCWLNADLVLGQTCGLPYARNLRGKVCMVGSPVYALEGCEAGDYYSLVIAAKGGRFASIDDIDESDRFAFNALDSQSGFRAMQRTLKDRGRASAWLGDGLQSGSHRQSILAVAEGRADFAAIDAVSWRLANRHDSAAGLVVPIGVTAATPGLPMISSLSGDPALLGDAIEEAIETLDGSVSDALGIVGFRRRSDRDYAGFSVR